MPSLEEMLEEFDDLTAKEDYQPIKAPFGWAGGKNKYINKLLPYLPYYNGWVDVFGGSGAVTLGRCTSKLEVYNDACSGLTDFYRCLRDEKLCGQLVDKLQLFLHSREEWFDCKKYWENESDKVTRAAMFFYLITYSFGKRGDAFGRSVSGQNVTSGLHLRKSETFNLINKRFRDVIIENLDFRKIFRDYSHRDNVFYCDPPYLETTKTKYFGMEFTEDDHKDLLECIFSNDCFVALSGHENFLYDKYPWDNKIRWEQYRSIQTNNSRDIDSKREEVLWIKERR